MAFLFLSFLNYIYEYSYKMFINIIALYRDIVKKKTYIKNDGKDYALPSTLTYAKMISSFTISLAHALMLFILPEIQTSKKSKLLLITSMNTVF